jgi:23S rRNA (uracil1939-C5)-methyltransferase
MKKGCSLEQPFLLQFHKEMNQPAELTLNALTYGGDSIGRLEDGRAVFVPFGIPGEKVRIEITEDKKSFIKGKILDIITPSPKRIQGKCAHFLSCGGCHYQHLAIEDQLEFKQQIITDQLTRLGGFTNPPVLKIRPSPAAWNYRNSLQFHLSPRGRIGFRGVNPREIIEIHECHLPLAGINETWPLLDFEPGSPIDRIELREGIEEELLLHLRSKTAQTPEIQLNIPISIVMDTSEIKQVVAGAEWLFMEVNQRKFRVSAGSFFQVNKPLAGEMVNYVLGNLDLTSDSSVLDLYCGVGLFSAFLATEAKSCIGIENSPSACEDFIFNLDQFENVQLYEGSVEDILPHLDLKTEIVIADPPRSGIDKKALDAILAIKPKQIAYVSCDPATLARDLKILATNGYSIHSVQPFDLFPQTYHIETITILNWNR